MLFGAFFIVFLRLIVLDLKYKGKNNGNSYKSNFAGRVFCFWN